MARLSVSQVLQLIIKPKNKTWIQKAVEQEERLRYHCEPIQDKSDLPATAHRNFMNWVQSFLPIDKYERFAQLCTTPVETVADTKSMFDELAKFLDAQDRFVKCELATEEMNVYFNAYMESVHDPDFWKTKAMNALRTAINSFLIIDTPTEQTTARPEPYCYLLNISNVVDVDINEDSGNVEYIIFKSKGFIAALDDEFYRLFQKNKNDSNYSLVLENAHSEFDAAGNLVDGLGYTPAIDFYGRSIDNTYRINKRGPITDILGKLDWLLFWRISVRYATLTGSWPIMASYSHKCGYQDSKGNECKDGIINTGQIDPQSNVDVTIKCPACSKRKFIGPGTVIEVEAPGDKDGFDMMQNPIKIVGADVPTMEFIVAELQRLADECYMDCVGYDGDVIAQQAVNEDQVGANFESKEAVLDGIKAQFERAHKFWFDTAAIIMFGRSYYVNSTVDYGNDYFLKTAEMLTDEYSKAKDAGMPIGYCAAIRDQTITTKFKNNPDQLNRQRVLLELEPYPDLALNSLVVMQINVNDPIGYIIKLNFTTFIQKFERETTSITTFGSALTFGKKIDLIYGFLKQYATEQQALAPKPPNDPGGNGNAPPGSTAG